MELLRCLLIAIHLEQFLQEGDGGALVHHFLVTLWAFLKVVQIDLIFLLGRELVIDEQDECLQNLIARRLHAVIHRYLPG